MKVREIPSARGSRANINNFPFFLEDCRTIFSPELHQNDSPTWPADEILRSVDLVNRRYSCTKNDTLLIHRTVYKSIYKLGRGSFRDHWVGIKFQVPIKSPLHCQGNGVITKVWHNSKKNHCTPRCSLGFVNGGIYAKFWRFYCFFLNHSNTTSN